MSNYSCEDMAQALALLMWDEDGDEPHPFTKFENQFLRGVARDCKEIRKKVAGSVASSTAFEIAMFSLQQFITSVRNTLAPDEKTKELSVTFTFPDIPLQEGDTPLFEQMEMKAAPVQETVAQVNERLVPDEGVEDWAFGIARGVLLRPGKVTKNDEVNSAARYIQRRVEQKFGRHNLLEREALQQKVDTLRRAMQSTVINRMWDEEVVKALVQAIEEHIQAFRRIAKMADAPVSVSVSSAPLLSRLQRIIEESDKAAAKFVL